LKYPPSLRGHLFLSFRGAREASEPGIPRQSYEIPGSRCRAPLTFVIPGRGEASNPESRGNCRRFRVRACARPGMTNQGNATSRTLPILPGAGSYGALSRPLKNDFRLHAASPGLAPLEGLRKTRP
jgi:hypothetical protein